MPGPPPPPPRLPPPPSPYGVKPVGNSNSGGRRENGQQIRQHQPPMPMPPATRAPNNQQIPHQRAPPPPAMMNHNLQRQQFNNDSSSLHYHGDQSQVRQQQINNGNYGVNNSNNVGTNNNAAALNNATNNMAAMTIKSGTTNISRQQQYRGGNLSNNSMNMPPPPPSMGMTRNTQQNYIRPPPPPMPNINNTAHQPPQQLQRPRFTNNTMMPPPPQPPQNFPYSQQQEQSFPAQQLSSTASSSPAMPPPPQQSRPTYQTNNTTTYPPAPSLQPPNVPKIDPSQIPRIPLFTRPHHAPATIYPTTNNGNTSTSAAPPPPLDSRYVSSSNSKMASPRLITSTVHTFPVDHATYRSCGDLPLGLIVTPLGCLSSLCRRLGDDENDVVDDGNTRSGVNGVNGAATSATNRIHPNNGQTNTQFSNAAPFSSQWNGREQGDVYSDNVTSRKTSGDVDYFISPFDGNGTVNTGSNANNNNSSSNNTENEDPERIPVIRGTKRPSTTTSNDTPTKSKTIQTITPPRCNRCNAYLNPFCTPSHTSSSSTTSSTLTNTFQGLMYKPTQSFNCNMCGTKSSIVISNEEDIANQVFETTALQCGTVEYEVGGEYCVRTEGVGNVFLYGVEYVPDGLSLDGDDGQHHHHGTMKSYGWRESLEGIRAVARELCLTAPRKEEGGDVVRDVRIGIFAFCQDMLVFPYIQRKDNDVDEEEELAVAIVSDVTDDPFSPLPLNSWSYNVGNGLESKEWHRICRILDSFTELMEQFSGVSPQQTQQLNDKWKRNCGGAALAVLSDALKESGGRGTLITTRRPNYGIGALRDREALAKYGVGSATEQKLFTPLQQLVQRNNDAVGIIKDKPAGLFYKKLGEDCAKNRVCLDIVVTSSSVLVPSTDPQQLKLQKNKNMREFLDVATLGELCRVTCGNFKWLRVGNECGVAVNGDSSSFTGEQLREELRRSALAYTGSDIVFKLRCSNGVQVKSYSPTLPVGNIVGDGIVNSAELELSIMHPGTSIALVLEHKIGGVVDTINSNSRKGIDMPTVFFQSAVLYTTKTGQRRVRVSTLGLPTSKAPADIFRSADLGAVSTMLTRGAVSDIDRDGGTLRLARDNLFNKCVSILANYRTHTTARSSSSGQLILPDSLQLLPLFCLSLRKSRILRNSLPKGITSAKPSPTADERAYHLFYGRMVSPNMSLQCVHPHLFQVSDLRTRDGDWITPPVLQENKFDEANVVSASMKPVCQLPKTMNPSIACLDERGMYILDDRFSFYLFIGRDVPDEKWQELLSVGGVVPSTVGRGNIPTGGLSLSHTDSAHKVRSVMHQLRMLNSPNETLGLTARNTYAPLILVFVGRGSVFEEEMDSLLVDDPDSHEKSYVDFLCDVHRSVREKSEKA